MKKKASQPARSYHSAVLDEFLSLGTPEELARTETRMLIAAKIQEAMTAKGIGKKQLAEMLGQNPSVVTKWLSGGHNFTVDTLSDIQRILGVKLLAVTSKPLPPITYHFDITITLPNPQQTLQHTGQAYTLVSTHSADTHISFGAISRQIPYA